MIIDTPEWLSNWKELSTVDINNKDFRTTASTVYEPAEDTFLVLDALQEDLESIVHNRLICQKNIVESSSISDGPLLVVELGSGAGLITAAIAKALRDDDVSAIVGAHYMAVDVNPAACQATAQTCLLNGVQVDIICGDLLSWMKHTKSTNSNDNHLQDLYGPVDILLFNPPYVRGPNGESAPMHLPPTYDFKDVATQNQLSVMVDAAWLGGGPDGVDVIKRALHQAADLLSERGVFYLLMIDYNYAALVRDEVIARQEQTADNYTFNHENYTDYIMLTTFGSTKDRHLACRRVLSRHVPGERLAVYRIYRPHILDGVINDNASSLPLS